MFFLVFVHGYNLELRYLQPWTTPNETMTLTSFTEYLFANGLLRFRIPMLFIISGYLYSLHDTKPNKQRIGKRVKTLLAPYLLWSTIAIAITYLMEVFPYTRHLVVDSHVLQIDQTRMMVHEYRWYEILGRWLLAPVAYQLWFIRVLLIYNIAFPFIRWCVMNKIPRIIFFTIDGLLWLATANFGLVEGEGLLFFSLGVWIQKFNFDISAPSRFTNPVFWMITFLFAAFVKTYLAFEGIHLIGNSVYFSINVLHKVTVFSGLIACWYSLESLVRWFMRQQWFVWLSDFSFMIYVIHAPFVAILINGVFEWLNYMPGYRMITFILLPLMLVALSVIVGVVLRKVSPAVYGVLTGGRGL
ncbi:succinoglycan biosynthesis protein exoh [Cytophagales bacterium WSM2-2]|nr:succinoglycan biosynthesis protein exoh [Cytophagales bacterium WSM2-2]